MVYQLDFDDDAKFEWEKLDPGVRTRLDKKLRKRLEAPRVTASRLAGILSDCYSIKDDKSSMRLIYKVDDEALTVLVLSVGKRANLAAYRKAEERL